MWPRAFLCVLECAGRGAFLFIHPTEIVAANRILRYPQADDESLCTLVSIRNTLGLTWEH